MITFTLGVKNLPPEALEWFASTGWEDPQTHSMPPVGGFRRIAPGEGYTWEWSETNAAWPTFIYVSAYDAAGNELRPPLAPARQYWEIRSGSYIYDWATTQVSAVFSLVDTVGLLVSAMIAVGMMAMMMKIAK